MASAKPIAQPIAWHLHGDSHSPCPAPLPLIKPTDRGALRVRLVYALAATLDLSSTKEAGPHSARAHPTAMHWLSSKHYVG